MKLKNVIILGVLITRNVCPMSYDDKALLDLAKNDPNFLSSPATIPLLMDDEQKELLASLVTVPHSNADSGAQVGQALLQKLAHLHTLKLVSMEPAPVCIAEHEIDSSLSSDKKVHVSSDGSVIVSSYSGALSMTGIPLQLENESGWKSGKWTLSKSGSILYNHDYSKVRAWQLPSGKELCKVEHQKEFKGFTASGNDKYYALCDGQGIVTIYPTSEKTAPRSFAHTTQYSYAKAGIFAPTRWFVTGSEKKSTRSLLVWDLTNADAQPICLEGDIAGFNNTSELIATVKQENNQVTITDIAAEKPTLVASFSSKFKPSRVQFSSDGQRLLLREKGRFCESQEIWDWKNNKCLYEGMAAEIDAKCGTVLEKNGLVIKDVTNGKEIILGKEKVDEVGMDTAGNYVLQYNSYPGVQLRNAKTGTLIEQFKFSLHGQSYLPKKGSQFLPNNKLLLFPNSRAEVYQLNPIDWNEISGQEKIAMLILEHNYRNGMPFSAAASAMIDKLQTVAQKRYPRVAQLSLENEPRIDELGNISEEYGVKENGVMHRLIAHDKKGDVIFADMIVAALDKGHVSALIARYSSQQNGTQFDLTKDHARRLYYLMHMLFKNQSKKNI